MEGTDWLGAFDEQVAIVATWREPSGHGPSRDRVLTLIIETDSYCSIGLQLSHGSDPQISDDILTRQL